MFHPVHLLRKARLPAADLCGGHGPPWPSRDDLCRGLHREDRLPGSRCPGETSPDSGERGREKRGRRERKIRFPKFRRQRPQWNRQGADGDLCACRKHSQSAQAIRKAGGALRAVSPCLHPHPQDRPCHPADRPRCLGPLQVPGGVCPAGRMPPHTGSCSRRHL